MTFQFSLYSFLLLFGSVVALLIVFFAWQKRSLNGGNYFFALMLFVFIWIFAAALEIAAIIPSTKINSELQEREKQQELTQKCQELRNQLIKMKKILSQLQ